MKMLVVIGPRGREREIREALARHGARAFTEVPDVLGAGATGAHLDTQAFPGRQTLVFSVLKDAQLASALESLTAVKDALVADERLHVFGLPAEVLL